MAILLYGVEVEIVRDEQTGDPSKFLREAALAHRMRAGCLDLAGKPIEAAADEKYARKLEAEASKVVIESAKAPIKAASTETIPSNAIQQDKSSQTTLPNNNAQRDTPQPKRRSRLFGRD